MGKSLLAIFTIQAMILANAYTYQTPIEPVPIAQAAEVTMPKYDIPLTEYEQEFIWQECQEYDLSYELVLGVVNAESSFNTDLRCNNDKGLMQLNKNTYPWIGKQMGNVRIDPYVFEDNVKAGRWYLDYLRNCWLEQEYSDEDTVKLMLLSYNRGLTGAKKYIESNGLDHSYVTKVMEFKYSLEAGGYDD